MSRRLENKDGDKVSCLESILMDCHQMYTDTDRGLIEIAESAGLTLLPPRKKITVMLMGNCLSGKSSFINWYVDELVQKTGATTETRGFTFVTSGCKRESLTGNATFQLYPQFKPLQKIKGVSEHIGTEICTSQQKQFSLVNFVDTPGLVDNDIYPFDVDQAILCLGDVCDLILVFFDPLGQAVCKRTLNIVEQLNKRQGNRLHFYLSRADEAGGESDRQRVMNQIVQELHKCPGLSKCAPDMPTIYIPSSNKPSKCVNQIDEVCHTIQKTLNETVQNTLNTLEKDCELICKAVNDALRQSSKENSSTCSLSSVLGLLGISALLLLTLMLGILNWQMVELALGAYGTQTLMIYLAPLVMMLDFVPVQIQYIICGFLMQLSGILLTMPVLLIYTNTQKRTQLQENLEYMQEVVKTKKSKLYEKYRQ